MIKKTVWRRKWIAKSDAAVEEVLERTYDRTNKETGKVETRTIPAHNEIFLPNGDTVYPQGETKTRLIYSVQEVIEVDE